MRPAWSVLLLTTLIGAGQGLFIAAFILPDRNFTVVACAVSLALLAGGLVASFFHLGRPERAWRTATMWRTSWLSREVIVLPAFMATVALYGLTGSFAAGVAGVALCFALFVCTGMIYACLKFLQEWHSPLTIVNYTLLGTASGFTLAVPIAVLTLPAAVSGLAVAALILGFAAWLARCASLVRNARLRRKSTLASAIGAKRGPIAQISQGFMGGSFNTREFFHGRPDRVVRAVRWTLLVLLFPLPAWLLACGGDSLAAYAAAFGLQYIGLLAERWYFFAEASHPQNLYYQSMA